MTGLNLTPCGRSTRSKTQRAKACTRVVHLAPIDCDVSVARSRGIGASSNVRDTIFFVHFFLKLLIRFVLIKVT